MRSTIESPHTWAMSVAFDDHGDVVPMRGAIQNAIPVRVPSRLPLSSAGP